MKVCTRCRQSKRLIEFANNSKASDGRFSWCRICTSLHGKKYRQHPTVKAQRAASYKAWAAANPEHRREWKRNWNRNKPHKARQYQLRAKFNITEIEYQRLLIVQNNMCAICYTDNPRGRWDRFAVDHDHVTGKVRGLLCNACNRGLGYFKDHPNAMRRAAEYVERR